MTKKQLLDGSKTVTRRMGWRYLKAGDCVKAVEKALGLKKGERQHVYGINETLDIRRERLDEITADDVAAEGFPGKSPAWFVALFCRANRCTPQDYVTRIEFKFTPVQVTI